MNPDNLTMSSLSICSVTFEHHRAGFGIGQLRPRISWQFAGGGDLRNWVQESYEIQVGRHDGIQPSRTYRVEGSDSVLVPWPAEALRSRESAWVKVRARGKHTDTDGKIAAKDTGWSDSYTVEAALLDKADWTAKLTTSALLPDLREPAAPLLFRKVWRLPEGAASIAKARLYITAHGAYRAYFNGQRIGDEEMAPGWTSYGHRLLYQTFDVTAALDASKPNTIGVEVAAGWFAGRLGGRGGKRWRYGDRLAFLAQLEVVYEDGGTCRLNSDNTWKSDTSATLTSEIYDGEEYDSRKEQIGWNSDAGFDDEAWAETEELEFPPAKLLAPDIPPVREVEQVAPIKVFKSPSGKTLVDFGQNLVGKLQLRLPKSTATNNLDGHVLTLKHAEVLERSELGTRPLRLAKATDTVVLSAKAPAEWSPKYTFHGFRYAQIDGWPSDDGMPGSDDIRALVLTSEMKRTGWFSCSEKEINQLHENVIWSVKGNFFSVPTDCPQRDERQGWTGDIQVFSPSANYMYNTRGFLVNWLEDVAAEQLVPDRKGVPPLVVPNVHEHPNPPGPQCVWHDVTVLTPWDLYQSSGDLEILRRQYPSMKAWVDQGIARGPNGLWDQNVWQYGDWLDPAAPPSEPGNGRTDSLLIADAYLVRVLETISKISSLLGEKGDADRYRADAARVKSTFRQEYITPSGLLVGDTQAGLALALAFGLFDEEEHVRKAASRLSHLVHVNKYRISTGFAGTPVVTHALSATGNHQLAYRMLLEKECPSWLYPIAMGATTIWERWDSMLPDGSINPGQMTSFNHYALGSVANWLHAVVGGVSPSTPGWRTIRVKPMPGGTLTSADVAYEGPYGRIECSWHISEAGDTFNMTLAVPPNSEAVVTLPSQWAEAQGDGPEKSSKVGSGRHHFSCPYKPAQWPPKPEFARSTFRLTA